MASISTSKNGTRRVLFIGPNGKRQGIILGRVPMKFAASFKTRVEDILAAKLTGHPLRQETAAWLSELDYRAAKKLAAVGLVPQPALPAPRALGTFIDNYSEGRTDTKSGTQTNYAQARRYLSEFFGEQKLITEITAGDAEDW